MRTRAFQCALLALLIIGPTLGVAGVALAQDRPAAAQGVPPASAPAAAAPRPMISHRRFSARLRAVRYPSIIRFVHRSVSWNNRPWVA